MGRLAQHDVVARLGDECVFAAPDRELSGEEVEAVVQLVVDMERGGASATDVMLDDNGLMVGASVVTVTISVPPAGTRTMFTPRVSSGVTVAASDMVLNPGCTAVTT